MYIDKLYIYERATIEKLHRCATTNHLTKNIGNHLTKKHRKKPPYNIYIVPVHIHRHWLH